MAQKSFGVDVLPGLCGRWRSHSWQPVCATQTGESRVHPHADACRKGVLRCDADRDGGAGSSVRKKEARARFAEMAARNENGLEPDRSPPPDEAPRHFSANLLTLIVNLAFWRAAALR